MQRDLPFLGYTDPTTGETYEYDRDAVRTCLLDLEGTLAQVGGMVTIAAVRHQRGDEYDTVGVIVKYDSFSPATNGRPKPTPLAEPEPDLDEDDETAPVAPVGT